MFRERMRLGALRICSIVLLTARGSNGVKTGGPLLVEGTIEDEACGTGFPVPRPSSEEKSKCDVQTQSCENGCPDEGEPPPQAVGNEFDAEKNQQHPSGNALHMEFLQVGSGQEKGEDHQGEQEVVEGDERHCFERRNKAQKVAGAHTGEECVVVWPHLSEPRLGAHLKFEGRNGADGDEKGGNLDGRKEQGCSEPCRHKGDQENEEADADGSDVLGDLPHEERADEIKEGNRTHHAVPCRFGHKSPGKVLAADDFSPALRKRRPAGLMVLQPLLLPVDRKRRSGTQMQGAGTPPK